MIDLLALQKYFILQHLGEGDVAVDFTMGNGHDTEFLSKTVGENGHVFAFDIQEKALASTSENLEKAGCPNNYTLILDSHHNVKKYVDVPIKAGMFNLGYLPGSGKKEITALELKPEVVDPDDVEMLQDLIMAAVNEAIRTVEETNNQEISKITGGMGLPGM